MRFLDILAKIQAPVQQTVSDDARSRIARQQQLDRMRMTREDHDPVTGERELWFTIKIASVAGYTDVPVAWQGTSEDDARNSFIEWLGMDEFRTVDFIADGKNARLSFRGSWVAGFTMDGKGRARPN